MLKQTIVELRRADVEEPEGGYTSEQLRKYLHAQQVGVRKEEVFKSFEKEDRKGPGRGEEEKGRVREAGGRKGQERQQIHRSQMMYLTSTSAFADLSARAAQK